MKRLCDALLRLSLIASVAAQHAFQWPPDRSSTANKTAPCGAVAAVGKRAEFPLRNGRISLVAQEVSWDAIIAISHLSEPKSNADFSELPETSFLRDSDMSSTCLSVADASPTVRAGDNATIQLHYSIGSAEFFACADIVYVEPARFRRPSISCFDADDWSDLFAGPADDWDETGGLSGNAVAGIVVAVVASVILMLLLGLYLYRRKCQRHRMLRQMNSVRKIPWDEQAASSRPTPPANVKMRDLS
ncbi:hypothetical protein L249_5718 [Ophiocordyceps polyrhachis-furcata BCC 54312]|uniref:Copper acquisition factor BIM1-like domain-containing protein n=1 Tax=Ophiocordyceps polyrhachis-furcata BCC 54312 TaxID=1330021 RepID=A0A367KZX5_9HYPO|nr:hypothetical protein L249_5718 [Ophiocordyceps polyrhachis-furcata BCC 54312]